MQLFVITDIDEIADCQNILIKNLHSNLKLRKKSKIGFQGGQIEAILNHNNKIWFYSKFFPQSEDVKNPRFWNAFGVFNNDVGNPLLVVEMNIQESGLNNSIGGLFAKDIQTDKIYLLHRGSIGGGTKGIGKSKFKAWYRGKWIDVFASQNEVIEAILISDIKSNNLVSHISNFINEVNIFKTEVKSGKKTRGIGNVSDSELLLSLTYDPEFSGRKKGKRATNFEYESYHGVIVDALAKKLINELGIQKDNIFNTQKIDLGIKDNGTIAKIYEVKTSSDSQSIYSGIGQLYFHSLGNEKIKKTLVLPKVNNDTEFRKLLKYLRIELLNFKISNNTTYFI